MIVILIAFCQVNQNVCSVQLNLLCLIKVIRFEGTDVSGSNFGLIYIILFFSLMHHLMSFSVLYHFSLYP